jgi:hypothetical protein
MARMMPVFISTCGLQWRQTVVRQWRFNQVLVRNDALGGTMKCVGEFVDVKHEFWRNWPSVLDHKAVRKIATGFFNPLSLPDLKIIRTALFNGPAQTDSQISPCSLVLQKRADHKHTPLQIILKVGNASASLTIHMKDFLLSREM